MKFMRQFVVPFALAFLVGCKQSQEREVKSVTDTNAPTLQLRLVEDSPSPDSEQMFLPLKSENGSQPEAIYVQKALVLSEADVARTSGWVRGEHVGIDIYLTDAASKRFQEFTSHNIGRRAAIVIEGRLRAATEIKSEISLGEFDVISNWSIEEAKILVQRFNKAGRHGN